MTYVGKVGEIVLPRPSCTNFKVYEIVILSST
jgi:hypothetical protein